MLNLSNGRSEKDRICFYTSDNGATAIRKENGKIAIEFGKPKIPLAKVLFILIGFFCTLSLIKAYVLIPLIEKQTIGLLWYLLPMFVYSFFLIFSIIVVRKQGGTEFLKNHGAEHMIVAAYKKFKKIPTIEEARAFSRISSHCGINIYSAFITSQLIGFVVYITADCKISEILLFLLPLLFSSAFPFNLIGKLGQFFTTAQPDDSNIELGIAALSALEKHENAKTLLYDAIVNIHNSKFVPTQNSQFEVDSNISINKWHCNGDCHYFDDFPKCPGENNIDNSSEENCPYYLPEI